MEGGAFHQGDEMKKDLRCENLETISKKLDISPEVILRWADEQKLPVYVLTMSVELPGQKLPWNPEAAIFHSPIYVANYFNEPLAGYAMLVEPAVRWNQGKAKVSCKTLLVSSTDGTPLTLDDSITLAEKYGRIDLNGPTGSFSWTDWWSFDEAKLRFDIEEARALKNGKQDIRFRLEEVEKRQEESIVTAKQAQGKEYTPLPDEKPLQGYTRIARRYKKSVDTIKNWKAEGAPIYYANGHVKACESCLDAWLDDWGKARQRTKKKAVQK